MSVVFTPLGLDRYDPTRRNRMRMFDLLATVAGLVLVTRAETDAQKIVGGAVLSAALSSSFRSIKET